MPTLRSKKSKVKFGLGIQGYTPRLRREPKEDATIPLWQPDGTLRYVSEEDLKWLIEHKKVDLPMPKEQPKEDSQPSSE